MRDFKHNRIVEEDLAKLKGALNYHEWIWRRVAPYLLDRVLDLGSGVGSYSRLYAHKSLAVFSDGDPEYVDALRREFGGLSNVRILQIDLDRMSAEQIDACKSLGVQSVSCLNVLEHIEDDEQVVRWMGAVLPSGGQLVILVPASQALFCALDRRYGHYRRYDRQDAFRLARVSGFSLVHTSCFNMAGALAWWISHKLLRQEALSPKGVVLFNLMVPLFRRLDWLGMGRIGLSRVIVLKKGSTGFSV